MQYSFFFGGFISEKINFDPDQKSLDPESASFWEHFLESESKAVKKFYATFSIYFYVKRHFIFGYAANSALGIL